MENQTNQKKDQSLLNAKEEQKEDLQDQAASQASLATIGKILMVVALVAVIINELLVDHLHSNSIYLLLAAGFAAILPYLDSFKAGGIEVKLKQIENSVKEVKQEVEQKAIEIEQKVVEQTGVVQRQVEENRTDFQTTQTILQEKVSSVVAQAAQAVKREARLAREGGGVPGGARKAEERSFTLPETEEALSNQPITILQPPTSTQANDAALQQLIRSIKTPADLAPDDDTWALVDQFKDLPAVNSERALNAKVSVDKDDPDWYHITLTLAPVGSGKPIVGRVYFLIHHTFPQAKVPVTAKDGQAKLERYAYGAFTVVALADGGRTQLKLDLAELPDVPKGFAEG